METGRTVPLIKMLGDQVLVEPVEAGKAGELQLPDNLTSWMRRARVVAVGEGLLSTAGVRVPLSVKPGEVVLYRKLPPAAEEMSRVLLGTSQYLVLKAGDLVAVVPA